MPPSATETVSQVVEHIHEKVVLKKEEAAPANAKGAEASVPNPNELPKLETGHKEPLVLSGILDQFESFDVTPVIGREFPTADLAKWLHAPNSDELLRDLAITSEEPISIGSTSLVWTPLAKKYILPFLSLPARCGLFPQTERPEQ